MYLRVCTCGKTATWEEEEECVKGGAVRIVVVLGGF